MRSGAVVIAFPMHRVRRSRARVHAPALDAHVELAALERAEHRLFAWCMAASLASVGLLSLLS